LSYTSFRFSDLHVRSVRGQHIATVTVKNSGKRAGAEVAELYVGFPPSAHEPPRQLKAYAKVSLRPGESKRVSFVLDAQSLATWDNLSTGWNVHRGTYQLWVGDSSRHLPVHARLTIS
jgi:beta-glucosidase